ncbi:G_PROTEIN_RECEP_F1_2 domain-containing protein [Caenorhabditis elegans]|uniref:G_PROTEIN_RECEP_F1_2 domain-containing protein n=1 Tax=Caenorhabditis elegans TaxID=6239 RepID=O62312_CAEEL|nr:G_PROTEIN_RECEP_F1_2 domain-containing protein [Caenorhabditis elegans]CAB04615.3 G_PROTEIN_RECEP_F1_2 domain-containing protein [Caenorhabditis elegans]
MRGVIWSSNYAEMSFDPDETVAAQCSPTLANTEMTGIPDMQWWINGIQVLYPKFTCFEQK